MAERKQQAPDLARRLGSVLRSAQDRNLGLRAVRAGLISNEDLSGPFGVEELLRVKGVAPDRIKELQEELDREDYALFRPDRKMPPEVVAVLGEPDRRMAEFVRVSRLGQGGIGEVWKAWDARLGRWVAIKLPMATPDQDRASERFTREALAAARLSHPNIVSIHRVAEENGRCFIVMQYVEGNPLRGMKLELRKALEILRDVGLAVHYAHGQGVIHRDLKPANIVIAADGRAFVLDFGLAHLQEAGRVQSREGLVAGTASYMSPEQARGEPAAREAATDIYALGATLYETVTGRPPFDGATFAETLQKVLYNELESPRDLVPSLPRDVETVILKSMDKDPRRRYATAKEFADDLDRCLRSEPISAGAITRTIRRSMKRNRRLVWVAAAALLAAGAAKGWFWSAEHTRRGEAEAREREKNRETEHQIQGIRDVAKLSIQAMLTLRRAGANERMGEFLVKLEADCAAARARGIASAELEWLLGCGYRAAMDDAKAIAAQDRALAISPSYGPALYEKAVYALGSGAPVVDLRTLAGMPPADSRLIAAVLAGSHEELEKIVAEDPARVEAWEALARPPAAKTVMMAPLKDREAAWRKADEVLTRAIVADRGYLPFWIARAEARSRRVELLSDLGRDPVKEFNSAEDDFTQVLRLRATTEAWVSRALLRAAYGRHKAELGENPLKEFDLADEDLEQAARLSPRDASVLEGRSLVLRSRAEYRVSRGDSPLKELETMESLATVHLGEQAGKRLPDAAWRNIALLWAAQAKYRAGLAEDPSSDYARADDAFGKVEAKTSVALHAAWARVRIDHARMLFRRRTDPTRLLDQARENLDQVPETLLENDYLLTRAMVCRTKGEQSVTCGHDPSKEFGDALRYLSLILDTNPVCADAAAERGHLELNWGRYRTKVIDRQGAQDHYGKAVRYFEEAMKINESLNGALRDWHREARRGMLGAY